MTTQILAEAPGARQLPEPCWTVIMADGSLWTEDGEWTPGCWSSRERAEAGLLGFVSDDRPAPFMEVIQEEFRCWHLVLICGAEFVYGGEVEQTHFEDRADLLEAMVAENVVQLDGVGRYAIAECCAECKAEIDGQPVEPGPVPVHLDQVPLFAAENEIVPAPAPNPTDVCVRFQNGRECLLPVEYVPEGVYSYSGWWHVDRDVDHHAVPKRLVR